MTSQSNSNIPSLADWHLAKEVEQIMCGSHQNLWMGRLPFQNLRFENDRFYRFQPWTNYLSKCEYSSNSLTKPMISNDFDRSHRFADLQMFMAYPNGPTSSSMKEIGEWTPGSVNQIKRPITPYYSNYQIRLNSPQSLNFYHEKYQPDRIKSATYSNFNLTANRPVLKPQLIPTHQFSVPTNTEFFDVVQPLIKMSNEQPPVIPARKNRSNLRGSFGHCSSRQFVPLPLSDQKLLDPSYASNSSHFKLDRHMDCSCNYARGQPGFWPAELWYKQNYHTVDKCTCPHDEIHQVFDKLGPQWKLADTIAMLPIKETDILDDLIDSTSEDDDDEIEEFNNENNLFLNLSKTTLANRVTKSSRFGSLTSTNNHQFENDNNNNLMMMVIESNSLQNDNLKKPKSSNKSSTEEDDLIPLGALLIDSNLLLDYKLESDHLIKTKSNRSHTKSNNIKKLKQNLIKSNDYQQQEQKKLASLNEFHYEAKRQLETDRFFESRRKSSLSELSRTTCEDVICIKSESIFEPLHNQIDHSRKSNLIDDEIKTCADHSVEFIQDEDVGNDEDESQNQIEKLVKSPTGKDQLIGTSSFHENIDNDNDDDHDLQTKFSNKLSNSKLNLFESSIDEFETNPKALKHWNLIKAKVKQLALKVRLD